MTQSGDPGPAPMDEAQLESLHRMFVAPSEQTSFLSPTTEFHFCQQWAEWECHIFEPVVSLGNSTGSMPHIQWEAERHNHEPFEVTTTASDGPTTSWPLHQLHQQALQPPQSDVLCPPHQYSIPICPPLSMTPAWQRPYDSRTRSELEHRATTAKKEAIKTGRKPADLQPSSAGQHCSEKVPVRAGGELSPVSSVLYNENGDWEEDDNEGEYSDESTALPRSERNKPLRVRNRMAARRCRKKTKQHEIDLINNKKKVTQERKYLDACVTALQNEVLALRGQILQHGSCDCEMLRGYIARAANSTSVAG